MAIFPYASQGVGYPHVFISVTCEISYEIRRLWRCVTRLIGAVFRPSSGLMLKITRIALPKEQLQKLTANERSLFLLLGYASNQINTLWKLVGHKSGDERRSRGKGIWRSDSDFRACFL